MMQSENRLVIIGAGSLGVMTLDAALNQGVYSSDQIVFIDDGKKVDEKVHGFPIIGGIDVITKLELKEHDYVIAIANNEIRKKIADTYELSYVNIIHPAAVLSDFAKIGKGNIVLPNVSIDPESVISDHVILNKNSSLGHNVKMESYSQASPGCQLGGIIGEGTFVGLGATVLPNIEIGKFSVIGAGAVVTKDIPDYSTAVGIPAKVIK